MSYTVECLPDAENELAAIWVHSADRPAVTAAANELDRRLAIDPEHEGESRQAHERVTFCKPPGILFHVTGGQRLVQVVHVWKYP